MGKNSTVRITFTCETTLRDKLSKQADKEGIPRSQLIVELLESSLGQEGKPTERNPAVNRLLYDVQERISSLEGWRREIQEWTEKTEINTGNLERTVGTMLNDQVTEPDGLKSHNREDGIPAPKQKPK